MPLVTVILTNYNHENFLKKRIESILNQKFQDFELIILDDASSDNSVKYLNKYIDHPKVSHLIINKQNSGSPFKQWEKGIKLAKGEYIWIAESDDFAESNFLSETIKPLIENSSTVLTYTNSTIVDDSNRKMGLMSVDKNIFFKNDRWSENYLNDGKDEVLNYLLYKTTINNVSAVLFRKCYLNNDTYLNTLKEFKNVGDLYTYIFLSLKGQINYVSLPLNNYRDHIGNTTKLNMENGLIYQERINCYNQTFKLLFLEGLNNIEMHKIKKACKYIIRKNSFCLIDFGYIESLNDFMRNLMKYKIFSKTEVFTFLFLFRLYSSNIYKVKGGTKRILKYITR